MSRRAIVVGGSVGGLFTAALLHRHGWTVDVHERSAVELAGRGAGINTHEPLHEALLRCGATLEDLGVAVTHRTAYGADGEVVREIERPQIFTSWDRLHTLTRARVPDERHHLGRRLLSHERVDGLVRATFADGTVAEADLLVGADGYLSSVRATLAPEARPAYAGYVVWRGVAREADLPADIRRDVFGRYGFHFPADGSEAIGYPIAGEGNDLAPGRRRYNWVWYRRVEPDALREMLTDADGRVHAHSIPPPRIRPDVIRQLREDARERLCPPFRAILEHVDAPFFTPIFDCHVPRIARDGAALVGDAACLARPHVGMGVTKATSDACALVDALDAHASIDDALAAYDAERVAAGRVVWTCARRLGAYLCPPADGESAAVPDLESLMRDTGSAHFIDAVAREGLADP